MGILRQTFLPKAAKFIFHLHIAPSYLFWQIFATSER
jgi:hypothetical protein